MISISSTPRVVTTHSFTAEVAFGLAICATPRCVSCQHYHAATLQPLDPYQLVQLIQGQELAESCRPGRGNSPKHVIELVEVGVLYRNHDRHFLRGSNALDSTPLHTHRHNTVAQRNRAYACERGVHCARTGCQQGVHALHTVCRTVCVKSTARTSSRQDGSADVATASSNTAPTIAAVFIVATEQSAKKRPWCGKEHKHVKVG